MDADTVQTAVRLPRAMHNRLKKEPGGVSEGIRRAVQASFDKKVDDERRRRFYVAMSRPFDFAD